MKPTILFLLFSAMSFFAKDTWPGVEFTEVRAYAWPNDDKTEAVILPGMALKPGAINKEGALLTADQVKRLLSAVREKHPPYPIAACRTPHNAFVFYNGAKQPVAFLEICFECRNYSVRPIAHESNIDLISLASIFAEHRLPMGRYADAAAFERAFKNAEKAWNESD
jgi:hypothetical protein